MLARERVVRAEVERPDGLAQVRHAGHERVFDAQGQFRHAADAGGPVLGQQRDRGGGGGEGEEGELFGEQAKGFT